MKKKKKVKVRMKMGMRKKKIIQKKEKDMIYQKC